MDKNVQEIIKTFEKRGNENYANEAVTQLEHALQCAHLAVMEGADDTLVLSALLHDIGHIMSEEKLPKSLEKDLHDFHENRGYEWIKTIYGEKVAGPIRLHVAAKRYLCTQNPAYENQLSPTSYKSYQDQGGRMTKEEIQLFEQDPYWKESIQLRKWDDEAKKPDRVVPDLEHYIPILEQFTK